MASDPNARSALTGDLRSTARTLANALSTELAVQGLVVSDQVIEHAATLHRVLAQLQILELLDDRLRDLRSQ